MSKWYSVKGSENDVVLSTRVRVSRNLYDFPFPVKLSLEDREKVNKKVKDAVLSDNEFGLSYVEMESLSDSQLVSLAERGLISAEFASRPEGRAILVSDDERICLMLCENDHIKIQVMQSGLEPDAVHAAADKIDDLLDEKLGYAFDEKLGYLTQCPTDLGTGMRASVKLHLPALTADGSMTRLSQTVFKLGLTLRNCYVRGTTPIGAIYRLSNQVTLGISEEAALNNLKFLAMQLVSQERQSREAIAENDAYVDKIMRAYGTLQYAHMIKSTEFTELYSLVRLGASLGIIKADITKLDEMMINLQSATINALKGEDIAPQQRDIIRAEMIREGLE